MGRTLLTIGILLAALAIAWTFAAPPREAATSPARAAGSRAHPQRGAPLPVARTEAPAREEREPLAQEPAVRATPPALVGMRVVTAVNYARDAERVPNVAVQLLAERDGFVAGGSSMKSVPVHPDEAPLWSGRTGADGEVLAEIPEGTFARDDDGAPLLRVRVVEPGYQRRVGGVRKRSTEEDEPPLLTVMAVRGATARGRVVDPEGHGVAADVRLRLWKTYSGVTKLAGGAGTRRLVDGWFELDLREDVRDGVLIASAGERGTGALQGVDLLLESPPQDLVLVARGAGRLRGRVVDDVGTPAAGVELLAWLAELDDELGSFVSPEPLHSQRRAEGGGRLWVTLQTGSDGRFDVRGLREAPYVLRARTGQGRQSGYPRLLTPVPVATDGVELDLVLSRPHLAVRLVDAEGEPWSAAAPTVHAPNPWRRPLSSWPEVPTVVVHACGSEQGRDVVLGAALEGRVTGPAEVIYEVPAGARYLVAVLGAGFKGEMHRVDVGPNAGRVAVEVAASPANEPGTVSVRVLHAGNELDGRSRAEPEFDVVLESVESGAVLLAREQDGDPAPFVFRAPAGRYRVVAEGAPFVDSQHGVLMTERVLGRTELDVDLVANTTLEVALELGLGARVELELEGAPDDADRAAAGEHEDEARLTRAASMAEVVLLRPERRSETVYRTVEIRMSSAAGTHRESRWPLGEKHLSQVLPQGTVTILARLPGGRQARARVELRPGETTPVKLRF